MVTDFRFPDLGEGVVEGEIRKWLVKEGDDVKRDQTLAQIETDKALVEMPSPTDGMILRLYHAEGDVIKVGEILATIGEEGETPVPERKSSVSVVGELPEAPETVVKPVPETRLAAPAEPAILATPAVRKLARDLGVDISLVEGTGPEGRILEHDVRGFKPVEATVPKMRPRFDFYGYVERVPVRGVRRVTAKRMIESQTRAAHVTSMDMADVTDLVALREREKEVAQRQNIHLTFMPYVVKAVVEALKAYPILNSTFDDGAEEVIIKKYYNIGMAVATEEGLLVPVIKGADQQTILELASEIQRLTDLASSRKINLADLKGGTFTITNYGAVGGTYGTPIINYPEVAILGTGRIVDAPLVKDGEVRVRKVMHLSLSFDHRVLDGAEAASFLNEVKKHLENPGQLLASKPSEA